MPCRDDDYPEEQRRTFPERHVTEEQRLKGCLDRATRVLCEVMRQIEISNRVYLNLLSPEAQQWWENHKIADAARQRAESEKRLATIATLTRTIANAQAKLKEICETPVADRL